MENCCIEGCDSYKYCHKRKIGYFKFPFKNKELLQQWLTQINLKKWYPNKKDKICSTHFHMDHIDFSSKYPVLRDNAVPMIFPLKHFQNVFGENKNNNFSTSKNMLNYKVKEEIVINDTPKSSPILLLCTPTQNKNSNSFNSDSSSMNKVSIRKIPIKSTLPQAMESSVKPYLLIVTDNTTPVMVPTKPASLNKKQAVLTIEISKQINKTLCKESSIEDLKENQNNTSKIKYKDQLEVNDTLSSKVVVFKLNRATGKIEVFKKEKLPQDDVLIKTEDSILPAKNFNISDQRITEMPMISETFNQHSKCNQKSLKHKTVFEYSGNNNIAETFKLAIHENVDNILKSENISNDLQMKNLTKNSPKQKEKLNDGVENNAYANLPSFDNNKSKISPERKRKSNILFDENVEKIKLKC